MSRAKYSKSISGLTFCFISWKILSCQSTAFHKYIKISSRSGSDTVISVIGNPFSAAIGFDISPRYKKLISFSWTVSSTIPSNFGISVTPWRFTLRAGSLTNFPPYRKPATYHREWWQHSCNNAVFLTIHARKIESLHRHDFVLPAKKEHLLHERVKSAGRFIQYVQFRLVLQSADNAYFFRLPSDNSSIFLFIQL